MGNYMACPNCMNTKEGDEIERCHDCGAIFCSACDVKGGMFPPRGNRCPKCNSEYMLRRGNRTTLGRIRRG